ncbi:alanyl-tRNA editing protein (plasmid) [Caballeronia sp. NK8]|uniref:alanyl-tRNA editing protein n=1 Tax=Caballeronia sp. NK8 TaxID=140098 RepID=UPI001BB7C27C|nr:alanyl-tRNA editing protein [Caballeronia sp. NK8]BCQ29259.1 alanyl-tRNA editing protein [Caballeronia sp. NK8]
MTRKLYLAEPHTYSGTAIITAIIPGERPTLCLDQTWFHPQGGGQKADRGRIGASSVLHVSHNADSVDHLVDSVTGLKEGMTVALDIDRSWRMLNASYHTAGHLIACVVEALVPSLHAVSGHQWPGEGRVEFSLGDQTADVPMDEVNSRIAQDIQCDLPVSLHGDPYRDRCIRIGDYPPIACGGTHVRSLGTLASVRVTAVKKKSGQIRVSYEVST